MFFGVLYLLPHVHLRSHPLFFAQLIARVKWNMRVPCSIRFYSRFRKYHTHAPIHTPIRPFFDSRHRFGSTPPECGTLVLSLILSDTRILILSVFVNLIGPRLMETSTTCPQIASLTDLGVLIIYCEHFEISFIMLPIPFRPSLLFGSGFSETPSFFILRICSRTSPP